MLRVTVKLRSRSLFLDALHFLKDINIKESNQSMILF